MKKSAVLEFLAVIFLLTFIVACNENTDISKKNTEDNDTKNISQSDDKIDKVVDNTSKDDEIKEKARAVIYDTKIKELKKEEKTGESKVFIHDYIPFEYILADIEDVIKKLSED